MTNTTQPARKGHPLGFWFFFWGEFAERCSYYGMRAILALYMVEKLGIDKGDAGTFMSLFIAACYFFPLIGGWIADNFLGKYWTIVLFSIPYVVAQFMVGIENRYVVFGALVLLAMGSGVIKPNISTLMGLTYDQQRPGQEQLRTSAFSWFYMAINIGAALSQFTMPWLRKNYGYQIAFLFPAGLMALALLIFALGKRFYAKEKIVRKIVGDPNRDSRPDSQTLTGIPVTYKILTAAEAEQDRKLKWLILSRIGLVFLTVMFFWAIFDQAASTWVFFADTYMDTTIFGDRPAGGTMIIGGDTLKSLIGERSFSMTADAIQGFNPLFIILFVPISVAIFKIINVKATTKMIIGFALTSLSMVIMSMAGYSAAPKQSKIKVTTPEGFFIIDEIQDLDKLAREQAGKFELANPLTISSPSAKYNPKNKKIEFRDGTILLKDGTSITIEKGRISAYDKIKTDTNMVTGVLETGFKSPDIIKQLAAKDDDTLSLETIDWVPPKDRITVWWQIIAYLVLTIAEILISVTGLELAFVAAPQSMKSFVTACWLAVVFLANLLINAPITQLYPLMSPGIYFAMLAIAMAVVILIFIPIAMRFNRAMQQVKEQGGVG